MADTLLRVVGEGELQKQEAEERALEDELLKDDTQVENLAAHIRNKFQDFKWHRTKQQLDTRYLNALRAYNGEYHPSKLAEIKKFGGSEVYSRLSSVKCRGATAMLRDIFVSSDQPWGINPTPVPELPETVSDNIEQLIAMEVLSMQERGIAVDRDAIQQRRAQLEDGAFRAAIKQAKEEAETSEQKLQDILIEGGFYTALQEFLIDLPIYPFACIKGPVVQLSQEVRWVNGEAVSTPVPKMTWKRVSCFDLYIDPGVDSVRDGAVIERIKLSRTDLNNLIGIPGYDEDAIREVLREFAHGYYDWLDEIDSERNELEDKENPHFNRSELIDTLEWHGPVQGQLLLDKGFTKDQVPDADLDYWIDAWVIGRHIIKAHINPNPRKTAPYYTSSFEPVPGSPYGHGVPEIINDIQSVANASLRSLVNNMSIASGPQVSILEDRLHPATDGDTLYPWKRWRFQSDPMGSNTNPISFFQPNSNAQELLGVYARMTEIADEVSAIPRYATGSNMKGGAAGTASGLSMLMGNASKVLQSVAGNVDKNVLDPAIKDLFDMMMLTDTEGHFRGDEDIQVRGVQLAMQKETDRMRRLEFLQITANPLDAQIVGTEGRAALLRPIAADLGLPEESIVPTNEEIRARQQEQALAMQAAEAQGDQAPAPGSSAAERVSGGVENMFNT